MKWKRYLAPLKQRWCWQLLGLLVLGALIWLVGEEIRIGRFQPLATTWARLLLSLVLVGLWAGPLLWSRRRAAAAARQLGEGLDSVPDGRVDQSAADLGVMAKGFSDAIAQLKKKRKGKRDFSQRYLYEKPWYLIIGPAGCGKTTLICNSDLEFILEKEFGSKEIKGKGGTRNCDWFFTKEAILLDTAGRYATQDSLREADAGAWQGLLDLLKRHRPRQPINGLLVAVSLSDLVTQSAAQNHRQAIEIRERINELYERLKVRFPIYLLITKCDLVPGFSEFFDRSDQQEDAQVWGATFTLADAARLDGDPGARTLGELNLLLERLTNRMLQRLNDEPARDQRVLIFRFAEHLAEVRGSIADFVKQVFNPNDFQAPTLLRGFYLTSATQFGTPSDRLMNELAEIHGLDRSRLPDLTGGTGRSYFINRLLREVVFPEARLVSSDPKSERRRRWLRMASYAAILGVGIVLVLGWTWNYTQKQTALALVRQDATLAAQVLAQQPLGSTDFMTLAPALDQLAAAAARFPESAPWSMGLGMYLDDRVRQPAEDAYRRVLTTHLLTGLGARLSERLRSPTPAEETVAVLKAYLMLSEPQRLEASHVEQVMTADWAQLYPADARLCERLLVHLRALLGTRFALLTQDAPLVQSARNRLAQPPLWQVIYSRIETDAQADHRDDYRLLELIGRNGDLVFTSTLGDLQTAAVPRLFTIKGLQNDFRPQSARWIAQAQKDAWVYGITAEREDQFIGELVEELNSRYADDYLDAWRKALDSLHIRPTTDIRGLTELVAGAAATESPLRQVIERTAAETQPAAALGKSLGTGKTAETAAAAGSAVEVVAAMNTKVQVMRQRAMNLRRAFKQAGVETDQIMGETAATALSRVDDYFARVRELTVQRRNDKSDLDALLQGVEDLHALLNGLEQDGNPDQAAYAKLIEQLQGKDSPSRELQRRADQLRLPDPLRGWINAIAKGSSAAVRQSAQRGLDDLWRDEVLKFCRSAIEGRYPFTHTATGEVKLSDFARFFGPGQLLDTFSQTHLTKLIDTTTSPWRWRPVDGKGPSGTSQGLEQIERAGRIRSAFFPGGDKLGIELTITPTDLDVRSLKFSLNIDGKQIEYSHGAQQPMKVQWPAPDGAGYARLEFLDLANRTTTLSGATGDWAWFRLLDQARIPPPAQGNPLNATFTKDGHSMTIEIRANSVFNPLQLPDLEQFRCPPNL